MAYANTTWSGTLVNDGTNRLLLKKATSTTNANQVVFCVSNLASADSNAATGFHVNFLPSGTTASPALGSGYCNITQLYLSPIDNGRIAVRELFERDGSKV